MKKFLFGGLGISLLLIGWGCTQPTLPVVPVSNNTDIVPPVQVEDQKTPTSTPPNAKLAVARTFTLEEIEANGGLKNWFRDLARANVAGKKTLVRIPVNHVFAFGCETPTVYCASTQTSGCFGPYLDLKGAITPINKANQACELACNGNPDTEGRCTIELREEQCSTLWSVEGYVTAASRVPEHPESDGGSCSQGELVYDFQVERVIEKIAGGYSDQYQFVEYK